MYMNRIIKKAITLKLAVIALLSVSATALAAPVTIDFDQDLPTVAGLSSWQESGFTLSSNVAAGTLVDNNTLVRWNLFAPGTGNNTQSLFWGANGEISTITMTNDANLVFDLLSFDASSLYNAAGSLTVTGYFSGGGSISQVIGLTSDLSLHNVAGMIGLSSAEFSFDGAVNFAPYDMDNINVNVVPVPAAVWLMGSGLLMLFGLRRRVS
jgi:hypothetical protein